MSGLLYGPGTHKGCHYISCLSSTGKCDIQTNPFAGLGSDQLIGNRSGSLLWVVRVWFNIDRFDEDTRLPLCQYFGNAVRDKMPGCDGIWLKQEAAKVTAEIRQH